MKKKTVNKNKIILSVFMLFLLAVGCFWFLPKTPMVSVVIPTYNREKLLPRAIDSILKQTYQNFEIIVVDDGSTDTTPEILKNYQKLSKKVKVITFPENKGVSTARNTGNKYARGKYITIIDSDDFAKPQFLEKAVEFMETHPTVTLGVPVRHGYYEKENPDINNPKTIYWDYPVQGFIHGNQIGNLGNIFKRSFIEKHNITYNNEYSCGEDYDFWMQMILNGATVFKIKTEEPLVVFRFYGGLSSDGNSCWLASQKIKENFSKKINYDLNKPNFDPCKALLAVKKTFPNVFIKEDDIQTVCPSETDKFIRAINTGWSDYFVFTKDNTKIYRFSINDYAKILTYIPLKKITVNWDNWGEETFVYDTEKEAYVIEK